MIDQAMAQLGWTWPGVIVVSLYVVPLLGYAWWGHRHRPPPSLATRWRPAWWGSASALVLVLLVLINPAKSAFSVTMTGFLLVYQSVYLWRLYKQRRSSAAPQ